MIVESRPIVAQVVRRPDEVRCPGPRVEDVRRLLVCRDDRLGDVVLTLPAVRALRRTYPRAWIGLLVRPAVADLARIATDVDEVVVDPGTRPGLSRVLAGFRPDATAMIGRGFRTAWAAFRLGLPNRVGTGHRSYSGLFHRRVDEHRRRAGRHEVEYGLSFAHRLGADPGPAEFPLAIPDRIDEACGHWLDLHGVEPPFVVLHPGSGHSCPSWSVAHHVQLAALLVGQGTRVVFSVGPDDAEVESLLDREPSGIRRLPRFSGSIPALAAVLRRASAVAASSTGPVHLAAALEVPTLAFHAPWRSCGVERWGPYADNGWALVADAAGAARWGRRRRERLGAPLLDALSPGIAARCIERILEGRAPEIAGAGDA